MKTIIGTAIGIVLIGLGVSLMAVGMDNLPAPSNPYPNVQHISPTPYPKAR